MGKIKSGLSYLVIGTSSYLAGTGCFEIGDRLRINRNAPILGDRHTIGGYVDDTLDGVVYLATTYPGVIGAIAGAGLACYIASKVVQGVRNATTERG